MYTVERGKTIETTSYSTCGKCIFIVHMDIVHVVLQWNLICIVKVSL